MSGIDRVVVGSERDERFIVHIEHRLEHLFERLVVIHRITVFDHFVAFGIGITVELFVF